MGVVERVGRSNRQAGPAYNDQGSFTEVQSKQFYCNTKCDIDIEIKIRHSPPSRAQITNEWRYTPPAPYVFMVWTGKTFLFNKNMLNYNSVSLTIC
jgi:hypothetical protein